MLYLDTSALAKLYLAEPETAEVGRWVRAQTEPLPFSSLHELELTSVLERRCAAGDLSVSSVRRVRRMIETHLRQGLLLRLTVDWPEAYGKAIELVRRHGQAGLRAMDGLHVACAIQVRPTEFITYDRMQSDAARAEGMTVNPARE